MTTMALIIAAFCMNLETGKAFESCKQNLSPCMEIETVTYNKSHLVVGLQCLKEDGKKIEAKYE